MLRASHLVQPRIVIVALLAIVIGLPFALRPMVARPTIATGPLEGRLIIVSPHNEQIRYETSRAFNAWRLEQGLPAIDFDWRVSGGTSDLRKQVLNELEAAARRGEPDHGTSDLFFGGGSYDHGKLASGITYETSRDVGLQDGMLELDLAAPRFATTTATITLPMTDLAQPVEATPIVTTGVRAPVVKASVVDGRSVYTITIDNRTPETIVLEGLSFDLPEPPQSLVQAHVAVQHKIPATVPIPVNVQRFAEAFPEETVGGEPLYAQDLRWIGVVLSSFGIVYNRDVLAMLDLPEPRTWRDLTHPGYLGWIALADPAHSGSIAVTYDTILRREGWTDGWALLRRTFANARYFTNSASKVPVDVSAGETAAGMCIDFYGRFQAGAVGGQRVGYIDPPFQTATTADPISLLRGAPHRELAAQFVNWLLTPEAQQLWQGRAGTPDGPVQFELRRQPIRHDLYGSDRVAYWTDPDMEPFTSAKPFSEVMPSFFSYVAPLSHAMAIDQHEELVAAWRTILNTPDDHPAKAQMLELFDAMPPELTIPWPDHLALVWREALADPLHEHHDEAAAVVSNFATSLRERYGNPTALNNARLDWLLFFRANYQKIEAMR